MSQKENQIIRPYDNEGSTQRPDDNFQRTGAQGAHLSAVREKADLSYFALARSVGIAPRDLLAIEAGVLELTPQLAKQIADVLQVRFSEVWLTGDTKKRSTAHA